MRDFKNYEIWHRGIDLTIHAYRLAKQLPNDEMYGLTRQIKRCATSIPANIAEGCGRTSDPEFKRFLEISLGSAFELETHFIIAEKLNLVDADDVAKFLSLLHSEQRQINTLISKIKADNQ